MARRRRRNGPPRCRDCRQVIQWIRSPYTGSWARFDPKPVDPASIHGRAYPVMSDRAWKAHELVEHLRITRGVDASDAEAEVNDMPWHAPHDCPNDPRKETHQP